MAKSRKAIEVAKFGGHDHLGEIAGNVTSNPIKDVSGHSLESIEAKSATSLESDTGVGAAAVIRMFEFGANPEAFRQHTPTKQELFNAHYKGIEVMLWKDGLTVIPEVNPRIMLNEKGTKYRIWVGAKPAKGHILSQKPQTLSEIAHGR